MSKPARTSPRKFSEKIALLNKKESETNAAFEKILKEVEATTAQLTPLLINSNRIPAINQIANGSRQRRRSSTTLKRSLSCRVSGPSRDRSLSSANGAPVVGGQYLVTSRNASQSNCRRSSYTKTTTTGQAYPGQPVDSRDYNNYLQREPYFEVDISRPDTYPAYSGYAPTTDPHHPLRRRSGYIYDDEQPCSLPMDVPNIRVFAIDDDDDDYGNNYADDEDRNGQPYQQVIDSGGSYREPTSLYHYGYQQQPAPYARDQTQQHQHQQQQTNNRLTSSLNKPYAICNSRSLPDMSNLGFGSSDEISVYGSPYGDESSPLVAYETNNHVNYLAPAETNGQQQQHQASSGQAASFGASQIQPAINNQPHSGGPVMTHNQPAQVIPAIQIQADQTATVHEAPPSSVMFNGDGGFSESVSYQPSQRAPDNNNWDDVANLQPSIGAEMVQQQQQPQLRVNHYHQGPLVKSASSNALCGGTANSWTETVGSTENRYLGSSYNNLQQAQAGDGNNRLNNHLSRSYNEALHSVGQSTIENGYWTKS